MTEPDALAAELRQRADELNDALVNALVSDGDLSTPAWSAAFRAVPRHLFAPRFSLPTNLGGRAYDIADATDDTQRADWLRAVYVNEALLTSRDHDGILASSCSAPSVVAAMIEASGAVEGDTVLEIGTGTGWTAGLLSHRLGSSAVTSVDIDARCVDAARDRLDRLGLSPTLAVADGYGGHPGRAPYDRIISTAAPRRVPPEWLTQVRPGGTILTDLRGDFAGNLASLTVDADACARGRFLPASVRFMPLRGDDTVTSPDLSTRAVTDSGDERDTELDPLVIRTRAFGLLAQLALPGTEVAHIRADGGPFYFCLMDRRGGSWARISAERLVVQGGSRRLWDELETAHDLWRQLGEPRPEDFTITITPDGHQTVALTGSHERWTLPL